MPEFFKWSLSIAAILIVIYAIAAVYLDHKEDKARRAYKAAKTRKDLADLFAIDVGTQKGNHIVVAKGPLNSGITYILCRGVSGDNADYLLLLHDRFGAVVEVKSARNHLILEKRLHLPIGFHAHEHIVYPASNTDRTWSPGWIDYTKTVKLDQNPYRDPEPTVELLFRLTEERQKQRDALEDSLNLERVSAEVRAPLSEPVINSTPSPHWSDQERWLFDHGKFSGVFERWKTASEEHRNGIRDRLADLSVNHDASLNRVDFHALPDDGRLMCLPLYLGIKVGGRHPLLDFDSSDPDAGRLVYISRYGPADAGPWRERAQQIGRYLGGRWAVRELDGTRIELMRLPELPTIIPFERRYLRSGSVFCGIDMMTTSPIHIPLAKMTHMLVCGQTGSGKSVGLNQLQRSLLHNIDNIAEIAACDLKGGVDLARFAGLSPKIKFVDSYADMHELAERWVGIMKARFAEMRAKGETNTTSNYRILIVDEFSEIGGYEPTKEEKPRHNKLIANLALLAQQGRAAGIRLILQTQAPTADHLPTTIMKNLPSVMCYRMNSRQNISAVFLGYGDNLPADPAAFKAGEYLFANGATGELTHVRTTACHEHDVEALKACLPPSIAA